MELWDWMIVGAYCVLITLIGLAFKKRAESGVEDFFLSGRQLPWWLAGTSLVATSFASDTPLFVTGLVRQNGISGNWHWWFMALASVASLFFFARLWRRAKLVTDVEFIELRYGAGPGAVLRGAKAIYGGVIFNVYALGAWPVLGLTKVLEEATDWPKLYAVLFCSGLALVYASFSGLWGVVATDFIQFILALAGAILLAVFTIIHMGGILPFWDQMSQLDQVRMLPEHTPDAFWHSPWIFFLSLIFIQWWARGIEGDGIAVQRLSACKNEKHSFFAMLWFNIAHYAIRPWPWIIVALASLVLLPEVNDMAGNADPERAYPRMILLLMPVGLKGLLIASFFAAFMSTVDTHLNWGASYVVNDVYRRFIKKDAEAGHYVLVARIVTVLLMIGGAIIALSSSSIVDAFYNVLLLFSGVGLLGALRWFWWRINAWSEITAMLASGLFTLFAAPIANLLDLPDARTIHLLIVVIGSTILWVAVTFLTEPTSQKQLKVFYNRIQPSGPGWKSIARLCPEVQSPDSMKLNLFGWVMGVFLVLGVTIGIGQIVLGQWSSLGFTSILAISGLVGVICHLKSTKWSHSGAYRDSVVL